MVQERIDLKNLFVEIRRKGSTSQVSRDLDVSMGNISDWKKRKERAQRGFTGKTGGLFRLFRGLSAGPDRASGYDITGGQHHERDRGGNYDSILQWQHI